jgi:hypothetical protein
VQGWEDARGYAHYFDDSRAVLGEIRAKLESLAEMLQPVVVAELDGGHDSPVVARIRKRITHELAELRKALCDFVSGGVLSEGRSHAQRITALTRLGFTGLPAVRSSLNANDIVLVMGLVFLAILFIPLTVRRFFDPTPLPGEVRLYILIPIVYAIAVVAAIYPKSAWRFARRKPGEGRPAVGYAASGALAAVAAFVVSLILRFAFNAEGNIFQVLAKDGSFATAWAQSLERWPWHLMTFFTTVAIAWMADDRPDSNKEPTWLRWAEAAALSAICVALHWTVVQLFAAAGNPFALVLEQQLLTSLTVAAAIGASIGGFVPYKYRSRARQPAVAAVGIAAPNEKALVPDLTLARPSDISPRIPASSS